MNRILMSSLLVGSMALIGCEDTYDENTASEERSTLNERDAADGITGTGTQSNTGTSQGQNQGQVTGQPNGQAQPPTADNPGEPSSYQSLVARFNRVSADLNDLNTWIERSGENASNEVIELRDAAESRIEDVRTRLEEARTQGMQMATEARTDIAMALDEIEQMIDEGLERVGASTPTSPTTPQ